MDRLSALEVFVKVVEQGSFTDAAQALGVSKSHCSKLIRQLEDRLKVRLIQRTTRQVNVTSEGRAFYERCAQLIGELEEAERAVGQLRTEPAGTLRLSVPVSFGVRYIGPAVADFMLRHPDLIVEMHHNDRRVDIVEEGYDLAIRVGALADSTLIARKLATIENLLCASPAYLETQGTPHTPGELRAHSCLLYHHLTTGSTWHFRDALGQEEAVRVQGRLRADNGDALVSAALSGVGLLYVPDFLVAEHIHAGRLIRILPAWCHRPIAAWAIYPHSRHLSAKVRLFIDFLSARFAPTPPWHCPLDGDDKPTLPSGV